MNGRFGPYLVIDGVNYKIPKGTDPKELSLFDCMEIASDPANASKGRSSFRKKGGNQKPFKRAAAKKATPKKAVKKSAPKKSAKK